MPILELKSFEKIPKKKPFKFLSGVFRRGASQELEITEDMLYGTDRELSPRPLTPAGHLDIEEEMENLHLSRRDNPYLSSCEALDDCEEGSLSPGPGSPRQSSLSPPVSSEAVSPPSYQTIVELHSHLVRSPPPVHWPVKVEEGADFGSCRELSPGSGGGSVERLAGLSPFSPVRGQTPAVSPARGQTPEHTVSSPSQEGERPVVGGVGGWGGSTELTPGPSVSPAPGSAPKLQTRNFRPAGLLQHLTTSHSSLLCSPRFNIYALHQRGSTGLSRSSKSKSSYLVTSPGRDCVYNYQPASRRSLAQLASSSARYGGNTNSRKSSMDHFTSWLPRRKRTRSQTRQDAKSMENLQSPSQCYGSIR